jgi:hypothetical protein
MYYYNHTYKFVANLKKTQTMDIAAKVPPILTEFSAQSIRDRCANFKVRRTFPATDGRETEMKRFNITGIYTRIDMEAPKIVMSLLNPEILYKTNGPETVNCDCVVSDGKTRLVHINVFKNGINTNDYWGDFSD